MGNKVYIKPNGVDRVGCEVVAKFTRQEALDLVSKGDSRRFAYIIGDSKDGYFYGLIPITANPDDRKPLYVVHELMIKHEKSNLHKKNFKRIIKTMAKKDIWVGAPWILRVIIF